MSILIADSPSKLTGHGIEYLIKPGTENDPVILAVLFDGNFTAGSNTAVANDDPTKVG